MDQRIKRFINKTRFWVFIKKLVGNITWCLLAGVCLGMVFEIAGYFLPWYFVHHFSAGAVCLSAVVAIVLSLIRFPSQIEAARALDKSGLQERAQTAVELLGQDSLFADIQKKDAYRLMVGNKISRQIPIKLGWKRIASILAMAAVLVLFAFLPSPSRDIAEKNYELAKKIDEEIAKVEEVKKELEKEADAQDVEEYKDVLSDIIKELQDARPNEDVSKTLERAEKKLNQVSEKIEKSKALAKAQELEDILGDLGKLEDLSEEELQELMDKLAELDEIDLSQLSEEEIENLSELSQQLVSGNVSPQTLSAAKASLSKLQSGQLAKANTNSQSGQNGQNGQNGQGNGNGQGQGQGSGQGNGQGGNGQGGNGGGYNTGSKNGKEENPTYNGDMVYIPNETGDDDNLTGSATEGENYISQGGDALTWSGNQVEYSSVYGEYKNKAYSKIQNENYPAGLQNIIKQYFELISVEELHE